MIEKRVITEQTIKEFKKLVENANKRVLKYTNKALKKKDKELFAKLDKLQTEINNL